MKPSFFSLFKRGKYYRSPSFLGGESPESEESRRERKEVERFAVAAVAFCLKHDQDFRVHFWKSVCGQPGDPDLLDGEIIEIEGKNWSDLKITNGGCTAVVEFKVGASLEDWQNPKKEAFWDEKSGGYGCEMQGGNVQRYTILGHTEDLGLGKGTPERDIICAERSWADLSKNFQSPGLGQDLFSSLATLGVKEFQIMKAKHIRISAQVGEVGNALAVMQAVNKALELCAKFESNEQEGSWWIGMQIPRKLKTKSTKSRGILSEVVGSSDSPLGWYGFQGVGDASSQRAIWLYCSSQEKAIQAKSRIADEIAKSETRKNNDWHSGWDLEITGALGEKLADFNWFLEIFSELGIGGDDR